MVQVESTWSPEVHLESSGVHLNSVEQCKVLTWANAVARFSPECDLATSTRSRSIDTGSPSCAKWTVNAT